MIVMKFGGTSVGSADAIRQVARIVEGKRSQRPVVVVSALSKVTDSLLASARAAQKRESTPEELVRALEDRHHEVMSQLGVPRKLLGDDFTRLAEALRGIYLLRELSPRSLDYVVSYGELLSSKIVAAFLEKQGVSARSWPGWLAGFVTDNEHGEAAVLPETYANVKKILGGELRRKRVPVVTGFLARSRSGERTTLGRGGSDYTAAIIGRAMRAREIQIWTDVSGIKSCDPRVVSEAFTLRDISFAEAAELAYFGAKVLHPKTVEPAREAGIPVRIVNTFAPEDPGTLVIKKAPPPAGGLVRGLAVKRRNFLVNLSSTRMLDTEGYLAEVFGVLARHDVSVDCLATSEVSVSLTVDCRYEERLKKSLPDLRRFAKVQVYPNRSIVCVVGQKLGRQYGVAGQVFTVAAEAKANIDMISQGASELNITFLVADSQAEDVLRALHQWFLGQPAHEAASEAQKAPARKARRSRPR